MKVEILQENLKKGIDTVKGAVATRSTLPVIENILMEATHGGVRLTATNLEVAVSVGIGGRVDEEGAVTVPTRTLAETVGKWPKARVDLSTDGGSVVIVSGSRKIILNGPPAEDYPPIPDTAGGPKITLKRDYLVEAIRQTAFAAATADDRPVLMAVRLAASEGKVAMAAADGHRLAVKEFPTPTPVELAVLIPAATLRLARKLLTAKGCDTEDVELHTNDKVPTTQASIVLPGTYVPGLTDLRITAQLVLGTFPNYLQLIPASWDTRTVASRKELQAAVKEASVFAAQGSDIIRLHLGADSIRLTARAEEVGEYVQEIPAKVEGGENKIAIQSNYLTDALGALSGEEAALEMTTPRSPMVWCDPDDASYVHVLMPMFVQ